MKTYIPHALIAALFFSSLLPAFGQNESNTVSSSESVGKPIEIHYTTLGGLSYSCDDVPLINYKDFEELIYPLNDYESMRLLKRSESSADNGKIFGAIGLAGLVTGIVGLLTTSSDQRTPFWITGIGGAVVFDIGSLFQSESQTAKFNSAQRYNRFARGQEQVLPKTPDNEKSLLPSNSKEPDSAIQKKENHPAQNQGNP